jgi:serine protease Do
MTRFKSVAALPLVPLAVAAALMTPADSGAQDPAGTPFPEREWRVQALQGSRAQLGVWLGSAEEVGGRTGVAVQQAVPGGPAERAGVRAGDVLLSLNGEALGAEPGRRLTQLMADVEPGDTVTIVLHREGADRTVRVVTDRTRIAMALRPGVEAGRTVAEAFRDLRPALGMFSRHGLELVDLNPGLGRYFGAEEGVLVTNVSEASSTLLLQPGDVILSIGGRTVRDPAHVRGILASYRGDEEVEIQVIRDRRTITVRATPGARR